jgi:RecJ-like exonuclease
MGLRDEAKMGLMMMQAEGQIKSLEDEEEQDTVECPDCSGTGKIDGAECEHCEGYGYHYADEIEYEEPDSESSEDTEVSDEEIIAEEGEGQFQEEYETPEGNTVNTAVNEVVEEFMTPYDVDLKDEEDLYPTKQGQFAYKPSVKFAVMKMK